MMALFLCVWLLSGVAGALYWEREFGDVTIGNLFFCLLCAPMGPMQFILGWVFFGAKRWDYVVLKKRIKK